MISKQKISGNYGVKVDRKDCDLIIVWWGTLSIRCGEGYTYSVTTGFAITT